MDNYKQFQGFMATSSLWFNDEIFGLKQFQIPEIPPVKEQFPDQIAGISTQILGKRIERFFSFIIQSTPSFRLVSENLQIIKNKITIGELDFIIEDLTREKFIHLEVVYKFYVYDPSIENEIDKWIGPNRKDSLVEKLNKLKFRQLPLIFKDATIDKLRGLNLTPGELKQEVCFKATLFAPKDLLHSKFPIINNECIKGYWINVEEFLNPYYENASFFSPLKKDWPVNPQFNDDWIGFTSIKELIITMHSNKKSPLIWMRRDDLGKVEYERFFVVWW
ncbi:hypothetical protein BH23BAC2_BH23BAC2_23610 [soil metagenome]